MVATLETLPKDGNGVSLQEGGILDTGIQTVDDVLIASPRKVRIKTPGSGFLSRLYLEKTVGAGTFDVTIYDHPTDEDEVNVVYRETGIATITDKIMNVVFNTTGDDDCIYLEITASADNQDFDLRLIIRGSVSVSLSVDNLS